MQDLAVVKTKLLQCIEAEVEGNARRAIANVCVVVAQFCLEEKEESQTRIGWPEILQWVNISSDSPNVEVRRTALMVMRMMIEDIPEAFAEW